MLSAPTLSAKPVHEMTQEEVRANIERIITSSPEMQKYAHDAGIMISGESNGYMIDILWLSGAILAAGTAIRRSRKKSVQNSESPMAERVYPQMDTMKKKYWVMQDAEIIKYTQKKILSSMPFTVPEKNISTTIVDFEDASSRLRKQFMHHPWFHEKNGAIAIHPFFGAMNNYIFSALNDWTEIDGVGGISFSQKYSFQNHVSTEVYLDLIDDKRDGLKLAITLGRDMLKNTISIASDGFIDGRDKDGKIFRIRPNYAVQRNPEVWEIALLVSEPVWFTLESNTILDSGFAKSGSKVILYAPYLFAGNLTE